MTRNFEKLLKTTSFLSGLFLIMGFILAVLGILDRDIKIIISSLIIISQSMLLTAYSKMYKNMWGKDGY